MSEKIFNCIVCPKGCSLRVAAIGDDITVSGNACKRGYEYGKQEIIDPKRNIASTVKVTGGFSKLAPVKTSGPVPKKYIFNIMDIINKMQIEAPVEVGQIVIENILDTGSDIIATRDVKAYEG